MHPIHSDMIAHTIAEDRRRAAIHRHVPVTVAKTSPDEREPSASRRFLSWFRGGARLEVHHHA